MGPSDTGGKPDINENAELVRTYLNLPPDSSSEVEEDLKKASRSRSELDIEGSPGRLELHILRALDANQLRADTLSVCSKLISEGREVIPVTDLSAESIEGSSDLSAVHLIWEGKFAGKFSSSRFISGLIRGKYSARLKNRIVIIAMSWDTFTRYFSGNGAGEKTEKAEMNAAQPSVAMTAAIGIFLLGIAMSFSAASPFLTSSSGNSGLTAGNIIGDISLASTTAGLILLAAGLSSVRHKSRRSILALITAFIAIYVAALLFLEFQPYSAALITVVAYGTALYISTTLVFFVMLFILSDFTKSLLLYGAAGTSFAYALYMGLSTYLLNAGTTAYIAAFAGFVSGPNTFFSYSLTYLVYYPLNSGNALSTVLYLASSVLFSVVIFWIAMDFLKGGLPGFIESKSENAT